MASRLTFMRSLCNAAVLACLVAWVPSASALRWDFDDGWVVNFDSLATLSTALRTSGTNCKFVGNDNGGCVGDAATPLQKSNPSEFSSSLDTQRLNQDDGDLNYKKWQPVWGYAQWTADLAVKGPDGWSGLLRGIVNYDAAIADTKRTELDPAAKSFAVSNPRLLDTFITKDMDIWDHQTRVRVGNQVISWGEDIYILGGANSINSIYLPNAHTAGTPLKTLFTPAPMVDFSTSIIEGLGLEAFYQWKWNSFAFDAPGTYFSTSDVLGKGGRAAYLPTSLINAALTPQALLGLPPALAALLPPAVNGLFTLPPGYIGDTGTYIVGRNPQTLMPYNRQLSQEELANPQTNPVGPILGTGTVIARGADRKPTAGQYGAAFRFKFEESGDELGVYYEHYNDKIPYASYTIINTKSNPVGLELNFDYGQNRDLYGLSYNFPLGDWVIGTEVSYRPRDGVAIDPSTVIDTKNPYYCANYSNSNLDTNPSADTPVGTHCRGYINTANYQFHLSGIQIVSPSSAMGWLLDLTGAKESILIAEAAGGYYPKLKLNAGIPYATNSGYALPTQSETGAVLYGSLTWPNVVGTRATLMPDLTVSQGISGRPATYLPGFIKGAGAATVGVNFDFKTKPSTTMRLDYTQNWGGGVANLLRDRNFMSVSVTTAF